MYQLRPAIITDVGRRRQANEDSVGYVYPEEAQLLNDFGALFVIADGVGGSSHGAECSQAIVRNLKTMYYQGNGTVQQRLLGAIRSINRQLYLQYQGTASSTITAIVIKGDRAVLAHVGDSVAYWLKKGSLQKLTNDHVLQVDPNDPRKIKLTRAIGYKETVEIDTSSIMIHPGGRLLLFTDGVTRYIKDDLLYNMCHADSPEAAARNIVNAANAAGGKDNITAAIIAIEDPMPPRFKLNKYVQSLHIDLNAPPPPPVKSSKKWVIPAMMILAIILAGVLIVVSGGNQNKAEAVIPTPEQPTIELSTATMTPHPTTETPPTLTFTPQPTMDTFNAPLSEGVLLQFEDTALTYARLGEDTASFAISPNQTYRIEEIYTDRDDVIWVRLYDTEEEEDGWIKQDDLPNYHIMP